MFSDLKLAARQLLQSPGFTVVAVLSLALGLGATTAIYSVVNGVVLRPLSFRDSRQLVSVAEEVRGPTRQIWPANAHHFLEWRRRSASFAALTAIDPDRATLTGAGEPVEIPALRVSANWCDTFGVQPALGRSFRPGEDEEPGARVAMLTDGLWRRQFGADPAIIGRPVRIDGEPHTIVGVLPATFHFPSAHALLSYSATTSTAGLFRPLAFTADERAELMGRFNYAVVGRLRAGIAPAAAQTELDVIAGQLVAESGEKVNLGAIVTPLQGTLVGRARTGLLLLLGAVGAVLLIVCVNLANLLLARAERRAAEMALRITLGARRAHVLRQILAETMLLACLGGALGLGLAALGLPALLAGVPADIPRLDEVRLDAGVLGFGFTLSLLTGLLFGIVPAWRAASADPRAALQAGSRTATGGREGRRLRQILIAAEAGLSSVLLIIAALLLTSFARLLRADQGFSAPAVLAADVAIPRATYRDDAQRDRFYTRLLAELAGTPGVVSAAITNALPLQGEVWINSFALPGDTRPAFERPSANVRFVSPDYFQTLGVPLRAGRSFTDHDRGRPVAVISERIAQTLWPGENALGRQFVAQGGPAEVIGIVGDVRSDLPRPPAPIAYYPFWEWPALSAQVAARATGDPRAIADRLRQAVHRVDADVPVTRLQTMQDVRDDSVALRRFQLRLAAVFAVAALLLTALGLYGVVAYSVTRRTRELGIRLAFGAPPSAVRGLVLRQGLKPVVLGLGGGVIAALAGGRALASQLYQVSAGDPLVFTAVAALLLAVGAFACWLPARRATRVNPIEALRTE